MGCLVENMVDGKTYLIPETVIFYSCHLRLAEQCLMTFCTILQHI